LSCLRDVHIDRPSPTAVGRRTAPGGESPGNSVEGIPIPLSRTSRRTCGRAQPTNTPTAAMRVADGALCSRLAVSPSRAATSRSPQHLPSEPRSRRPWLRLFLHRCALRSGTKRLLTRTAAATWRTRPRSVGIMRAVCTPPLPCARAGLRFLRLGNNLWLRWAHPMPLRPARSDDMGAAACWRQC